MLKDITISEFEEVTALDLGVVKSMPLGSKLKAFAF